MPKLLRSVRHSLSALRGSRSARVEFCDSCSQVTDATTRAVEHRRAVEAHVALLPRG
ncbi:MULTISPECIES: hypothetical protein [unclassified Streptomyces]|uniref:hypothetical protein n=1 Tax=unclassified Streptomyces TaxID=2593676 RepID=UPI0023664D21|nr:MULTISPECIES: hypothetical protein [unclassified Streptomyces]MDF3139971.1 hypothetical protein [Streptomyces sp. T21Q-yed]WDF39889.1 hypothetical protein PBV52_25385 [Streptomyces sp. T12]